MKRMTLAALAVITVQGTSASAVSVNSGETIRGAYSFVTTGVTELEPAAFLLRLTSADPLANGDSVGLRYLDSALNPLSFTRFDSVGSVVDPTIGITFDTSDFLPGLSPNVPQTGFIEIVGLRGSFDVLNLNLTAVEQLGAIGILRQNLVTEFDRVEQAPSPVPLPGGLSLAITGLLALFGTSLGRRLTTIDVLPSIR